MDEWTIIMRAQLLLLQTINERIRVATNISRYTETSADRLTTGQITTWLANKPTAITRWTYYTNLKAFLQVARAYRTPQRQSHDARTGLVLVVAQGVRDGPGKDVAHTRFPLRSTVIAGRVGGGGLGQGVRPPMTS